MSLTRERPGVRDKVGQGTARSSPVPIRQGYVLVRGWIPNEATSPTIQHEDGGESPLTIVYERPDGLSMIVAKLPERAIAVYSSHLFEHVADVTALVDELERVLAVDGLLHIVVPHFSNAYYYSDPTHRRPFGLYTFSYFAEDPLFRRRVPTYGRRPRLRLETARLNFRSAIEFRVRWRLKASVGRLVNASVRLQEFYEENLAALFPCYELEFTLRKMR